MAIQPVLYTSSHGLDPLPGREEEHRFLPRKLKIEFDITLQKKFFGPEINAKGGQELNNEIISKIVQNAKNLCRSGTPQVIIVLLGDNNLRNLNQPPNEYLKMIEDLLEQMQQISKCHLVLTSLLPSPKTNWKCKFVFRDVSNTIKELVGHENLKASFMNLNGKFLIQGEPDLSLFLSDKIHLNERGAKILAASIKNHLNKLPKKIWK